MDMGIAKLRSSDGKSLFHLHLHLFYFGPYPIY